jgi:hypothetical protein
MQSIIICPKLRKLEVFPWLHTKPNYTDRLLIAARVIALVSKHHSANTSATNYLASLHCEFEISKKLHHQNLLLLPIYPTPFPHMAEEELSDEQVRQLLKDAEERLRSKKAGSKTSLTLQNRYLRPHKVH